jgi:hypothetical protein
VPEDHLAPMRVIDQFALHWMPALSSIPASIASYLRDRASVNGRKTYKTLKSLGILRFVSFDTLYGYELIIPRRFPD